MRDRSTPDTTSRREPPCVEGHPLIGNTLDFLEQPVGFFVDAYQRHGSVFRFNVPGERTTVIGGGLARELLLEKPGCPMHRRGLFRPFTEEVGVGVFDLEGETHERVRALLRLPYSRQTVSQFVPEIEEVVNRTIGFWNPNETHNLMDVSARLAIQAMMTVVTPINIQGWTDDFHNAGNRVMYAQFGLMPHAGLRTPGYLHARDRMRAVIDEVVERHTTGEFANDSKTYMVDSCLRATNATKDKLDPNAIRGICFYALAGSEIYIGRVVGFMIYELLKNRRFLENILAEIDSTKPGNDLRDSFRRMAHLRAAYLETLRCYPLIPGYSYYANEDMTVAGYHIDKGEKIVFAPYLAHFSHEHFPNPTAFNPERHMHQQREFANSKAFSPFGVGGHACIAPGMVETLALTIVTTLLRNTEMDLTHALKSVSHRLAPLLSPKDPIEIRVRGKRHAPDRSQSFSLAEAPDFSETVHRGDHIRLPEKTPEIVPAGEWLIHQGAPADAFFILLEGSVSIWKKGENEVDAQWVVNFGPGTSFGEIGLLKNVARTASVKAEEKSKVLRFSEEEFATLVGERDLTAHDLRSLYYSRYIRSMLRTSLSGISEAFAPESMSWKSFADGEVVFHQGDHADAFYIIVEGEAEVSATRGDTSVTLARLSAGEFFGELGILNSHPRNASVLARGELKTLCIERSVFLDTVASSPAALSDLALTVCQRLIADVRAES